MKDNEYLMELVRISCKYPEDTAYVIANFRDPFNWLAKSQLNQTKINKLIDTLKNKEDKNGKTTFEKSELLIFLGKNIEHVAKIVFYNMVYIFDVIYVNIKLGADARSIEKTVLFEYGESSKEYVSFFFNFENTDLYNIADNNTTKTIYKQLEDNSIKTESIISDVTFNDVAGIESVKAEVTQLVDFMKNPEKYNKLGAKIPKGILFTGLPGCLPAETEYFNGSEWKRIDEYKYGEKVMQFDKDTFKAALTIPTNYVKYEEDTFYQYKSTTGIMVTSMDHKILTYSNKNGKPRIFKSIEEFDKSKKSVNIPRTFDFNGNGINIKDDYLRLKIAVFADGHFPKNNTTRVVMNLKKDRKKIRLEKLLKETGTEFNILKAPKGYKRYSFYMDNRDKNFPKEWINLSLEQKNILMEEILKWDGSFNENDNRIGRYSTTSKSDADIIQFISHSIGIMASIYADTRENKYRNGVCYSVKFSNRKTMTLKNDYEKIKSTDGFKYCLTVDTGFFLVRQNGKIFITGNTGKTLMAKAVAGEAGCHFIAESGSKFVQKYVGQGAREIEKMFKNARKFDSCVLFIDEIDAFTQMRDSESKGDDTINQFLTELDGFNSVNDKILIIGATNRVELMDPAVLRPGRFDRKVHFDLPDIKGREAILKIHGKNKPFAEDVDFNVIAGKTIGMSGADLENLLNEAAILGATKNADFITMEDIEKSSEKIIMGLAKEKKVTEEEKLMVAVHETGHAVAMHILNTGSDLHSLTIIPRGDALGYARAINIVEKGYKTKNEYLNSIKVSLAGLAAEEVFIGENTSGCSSDLIKATSIASQMVLSNGMNGSLYVEIEASKDSKKEIEDILKDCYKETKKLLKKYKKEIFTIINELIKKETLYSEDIIKILGENCKGENTYKNRINILKSKLAEV